MLSTTAGAPFGRRLLPHVVDDLASKKPNKECFSIPRSSDPKDGWRPITFSAYAAAIDHLSHSIIEQCGTPEPNTFPTLAYIGPNDARYVVLFIAAMKTGYKALFISPRNSHEAQMSLFKATDCQLICFPDSHKAVVHPWLQERDMRIVTIDSLESCFAHEPVTHFPYERTFEETEWMPAVVLHTSGSTGLPKPFVVMHGLLAAFDAYHDFPELNGHRTFTQVWSEIPDGLFAPVPFFHAGGIYLFMSRAIYWGNPMSLGMADRPLSPDLVVGCLKNLDVQAALIPPVILEYMSLNPVAVQALLPLKMVAFGGGELATKAGNVLAKQGVKLVNAIAATEFSPFTNYVIKDPELWQYFLIESDIIGIDWRLVEGYDNVYKLVFARESTSTHPGYQTCFYTFRDDRELDTKDLFTPHPTLKVSTVAARRFCNLDIIVLSNGEKLNPVGIEDLVERHPLIKGALVVGSGRFQTALLLEPNTPVESKTASEELIDAVWPTIDQANKETVAHGRIAKEYIMVTSSQKTLPRGGKMTIQRANANKLYRDEIDQLYTTASETDARAQNFQLDLGTEEALTKSIQELFGAQLRSGTELDISTDIYIAGIDSLQVISVCRRLKSGLTAAGHPDLAASVSIGEIYKHRTLYRLGKHLFSQVAQDENSTTTTDTGHEIQMMERTWKKYTQSLPTPKSDRPSASTEGQTVILTGSTGMLGSYMLARLLSDPQVGRVACLNRAGDGGAKQQEKAMQSRGLSTDFSKCAFYFADLGDDDFGLGNSNYEILLEEVDRIYLVAWPVNFNLPFESFEPHIRGVRNFARFASTASKRINVTFISTVDTCDGWDASKGPIPEARLQDFSLPSTGYGRSKMVASLVLEDAAKAGDFSATIIRVGQVAGSELESHAGVWNRHEWVPSIIASSIYLGALPADLAGKNRVDWLPVEKMVDLIFEVAGSSGYFHGVNPRSTTWTELAPAIQEFYGKDRIAEMVSFKEWVARLENSQDDDLRSLDKNPSLKLLDLSRTIAASPGGNDTVFSTSNASRLSSAVRNATAVTPQLMVQWCKQWGL
ncbi:hypothetical protein F5Y18DRAFT_414912 [Xylariaceae sp. FL1019]|nr:hypothetical protein F5Y18DRAFT_414912 [Xylariaceae sp. FL1019]